MGENSLSHIRKVSRFIKSQERKELKRKMNGYNSLSNKPKSNPSDFSYNPETTINDIIARTLDAASKARRAGDGGLMHSTSRTKRTQVDRLMKDVVSPEVRETWHNKIGMNTHLADEDKEKLRQSVVNRCDPQYARENDMMREMKLNALARAWVNSWLMAKLDLTNQERVPR